MLTTCIYSDAIILLIDSIIDWTRDTVTQKKPLSNTLPSSSSSNTLPLPSSPLGPPLYHPLDHYNVTPFLTQQGGKYKLPIINNNCHSLLYS